MSGSGEPLLAPGQASLDRPGAPHRWAGSALDLREGTKDTLWNWPIRSWNNGGSTDHVAIDSTVLPDLSVGTLHKIGCALRGANVEEAHDLTDFLAAHAAPGTNHLSTSHRQRTTLLFLANAETIKALTTQTTSPVGCALPTQTESRRQSRL
jgi:hypothetical protein